MRLCGLFVLTLVSISAEAVPLPATRFDRESERRFLSEGRGYRLVLEPRHIRVTWSATSIGMTLRGAREVLPIGEEPAAGTTNYLIGDAAGWRTRLAGFARVRYREIYPGIDLVFYGAQGSLEYDFVLAPFADPGRIRFALSGARGRLTAAGDLQIGEILWKKPHLYQDAGGARVAVAGRFRLRGNIAGFEVGSYDRTLPLVIDPVLAYNSYIGGNNNEAARGVAVDAAGNAYITGYTTTSNLPVSRNAAQSAYGGHTVNLMTGDVFVAKYSPAGVLLYLTYLGGSGDDIGSAIAVDAAGNAYVTGYTNSRNFPVSANAPQSIYAGAGGNMVLQFGDAFVTKLSPDGDKILYSTYLGGQSDDLATAIAIDNTGAAYITGATQSNNFPTTQGVYQPRFRGSGGQPDTDFGAPFFISGDAFIAKLNPAGTQLVWATYLGGLQDDTPMAIALDKTGNVIVAGNTISPDFPTTPGALQRTYRGTDPENPFFHLGDGFVTKLSPDASTVLFSTFLGASGDDCITAVAVDAAGAIYLTGATSSSSFPVTAGAYRTRYSGPTSAPFAERELGDAFLAKLDPTGASLIFCTYIGGSEDDGGFGLALAPDGSIYVTGHSVSPDFATTTDAAQRTNAGKGGQNNNGDYWGDAFLVQISADGKQLVYSTLLGGSSDDTGQGVAVDSSGNVWVVGATLSSNFPTTSNAAQKAYGGSSFIGRVKGDGFVARFSGPVSPPVSSLTLSALTNAASNAAGTVSPGMIFVAYGDKIGPATLSGAALDSSGKLATIVAETQMLFDGVPAPLVYVLNKQVSGIAPYSTAGKSTTQVVASYQGQKSAPLTVKVAAAVPALFSADFSGAGQGAILNEDNSYNTATNPAAAGAVIVLFGTGEGQTIPAGVDGLIANVTFPVPALPVTVSIGGQPVQEILYKGAAPQQTAGLLQINLRIPATVPKGNQPIIVTVGGIPSPPGLTVAVK